MKIKDVMILTGAGQIGMAIALWRSPVKAFQQNGLKQYLKKTTVI